MQDFCTSNWLALVKERPPIGLVDVVADQASVMNDRAPGSAFSAEAALLSFSNYGVDALVARVRGAFPAFNIQSARMENAGGDHVLLIVNGNRVFRFPRAGMHDLDLEMKTLLRFQTLPGIPTPTYDYVDPLGHFAGYRLIAGSPLTEAQYVGLPPQTRAAVLSQIANFLSALHGLDPQLIAPSGAWPKAWGAADYADRIAKERMPLIGSRLSKLAPAIEAFLEDYRTDTCSDLVVVHGDLVTDHILYDDKVGGLGGIIDFSDVALGDPALDVAGCWAYGPDAVSHLVRIYDPNDLSMHARSRNHFIRYRIDQLFDLLTDDAPTDAVRIFASDLAILLAAMPTNLETNQRRR